MVKLKNHCSTNMQIEDLKKEYMVISRIFIDYYIDMRENEAHKIIWITQNLYVIKSWMF